ncbi:helix-turn-helix domain-containing protein [Mycobacterium sp. ITM-2016-00318]|uniref:helix-turn-helix domain-containing protein n=1 Tax=Mycobacterium sp. ITM-2016-00318 TaxID=2099693 RepID=UPI0037CADE4A
MSANGHQLDCAAAQLELSVVVSAREAAHILGCTTRHVRRLAADLEGEEVGGRWLFSRSAVEAYAKGRRNGRAS